MPRRSWRPPRGLIKAGGPGAKVESAGIGHSPRTWLELASTTHLFSACRPYVVCVAGGKDVYTCGMHHLGLRDAIIDASVTDEPATLLADFTKFVFTHAAQIRPGQTFQSGPGKPRLRMQEDAGAPYEPGDLFGNPYGTWRLRPA